MNVQYKKPIPIIDLFAGPGGLGERFSSVTDSRGRPAFRIGLSIEKEPSAHKTLTLRAVFRQLRGTPALEHYFRYVRGEIDEKRFRAIPEIAHAFDETAREARMRNLAMLATTARKHCGASFVHAIKTGPNAMIRSVNGSSRIARVDIYSTSPGGIRRLMWACSLKGANAMRHGMSRIW